MNILLNSKQNEKRNKHLKIQIEHYKLRISTRTLQRHLKRRKAEFFKKRKIKKLKDIDKAERVKYETRHKSHTIKNFWRYIHFIDETHINSEECMSQRVLKTEDTATKPENLQELSFKNTVDMSLHIAASIFYYHKSSLIFYNNDKKIFSDIKVKKQKARMFKRRQEESEEI